MEVGSYLNLSFGKHLGFKQYASPHKIACRPEEWSTTSKKLSDMPAKHL
jgi:hypothetical protein